MTLWDVRVVEVRHATVLYTVEAETAEEAVRKAEKGDTVAEEEERMEIADRHVDGKPERVEDEGEGPAIILPLGSLAQVFGSKR